MERTLLQDAERIEELTENRIPFDRACWIALYIQRITSGMTHEQAIAAEELEKRDRDTARVLIAKSIQMTPTNSPETRFDYKHNAWVVNGVYAPCGHGQPCTCYGTIHQGKPPAADADLH